MKLKIRKSVRRKYRNTKRLRKTNKRRGGAMRQNIISVRYNNIEVKGQELSKSETQQQPKIEFQQTGALYTVIMWDPDVPQPIQPGYAHWILINLKSSDDIQSQSNILLSYTGPSPPSGTHRYFFGLFAQAELIIDAIVPPRSQFDVDKFISTNNLTKIAEIYMKVSSIRS
jgi:phosphatidylethanolamine-binding protein (PEBP) family uncharacterized protein